MEVDSEFTYKTLLDDFAMAALSACNGWMQDRMEGYPEIANRCYAMAEAMLKAREIYE